MSGNLPGLQNLRKMKVFSARVLQPWVPEADAIWAVMLTSGKLTF